MNNYLAMKYQFSSKWVLPVSMLIAIVITIACNPNKQTNALQQDCVNNASLTSVQTPLKLNGNTPASTPAYHIGDIALVGGYLEVENIKMGEKVRGETSNFQVITRSALFEVEAVDNNRLLVRAWGVNEFPLAGETHKVRMKFDAYNTDNNSHLENPLNSYLSQELSFPRQNQIDDFIGQKIISSNDEEDRRLKTFLLNQRIAESTFVPLSRGTLVGEIDANNANPWCAKPDLASGDARCAPFYTNRVLNFEINLLDLTEEVRVQTKNNINIIFNNYKLRDPSFGTQEESDTLNINLKKWRYLMQWQRVYDDQYGIYQFFTIIEHCKTISEAGSDCVLLNNNLAQAVNAINSNLKYEGINGKFYSLLNYLSAVEKLTSITPKSFTGLLNSDPVALVDADHLSFCNYNNQFKCDYYNGIFASINSAVNSAQIQGVGSALFLDYLKKSNRALLEQTQSVYLEVIKGIQAKQGLELGVATNWLRKKEGVLTPRYSFQNILADSSSDDFFANDPISNDIKVLQIPFKGFDHSVSGSSSQAKFEFQVLRSSEQNKDTFSYCDQIGALLMIDGKYPLHVLSSVNSVCKKTNGYSEVNIGAVDESVPDEFEVSAKPRTANSDTITDANCK
ncbi:MAG: hypothetical protein KBD78_11695 [Oligoflexales bacterium]|nr:hypothetical protein [Oligoflexales bacterium]